MNLQFKSRPLHACRRKGSSASLIPDDAGPCLCLSTRFGLVQDGPRHLESTWASLQCVLPAVLWLRLFAGGPDVTILATPSPGRRSWEVLATLLRGLFLLSGPCQNEGSFLLPCGLHIPAAGRREALENPWGFSNGLGREKERPTDTCCREMHTEKTLLGKRGQAQKATDQTPPRQRDVQSRQSYHRFVVVGVREEEWGLTANG